VQLFVPGDGGDSENAGSNSDDEDHAGKMWPANRIVSSDNALVDIFEPFVPLNLYYR
jgi:hypothetical protein